MQAALASAGPGGQDLLPSLVIHAVERAAAVSSGAGADGPPPPAVVQQLSKLVAAAAPRACRIQMHALLTAAVGFEERGGALEGGGPLGAVVLPVLPPRVAGQLRTRLATDGSKGMVCELVAVLHHLAAQGLLDAAALNACAPMLVPLLKAATNAAKGSGNGPQPQPRLQAESEVTAAAAAQSAGGASASAAAAAAAAAAPWALDTIAALPAVLDAAWAAAQDAAQRTSGLTDPSALQQGQGQHAEGREGGSADRGPLDRNLLTALRGLTGALLPRLSVAQLARAAGAMAAIGCYSHNLVNGIAASAEGQLRAAADAHSRLGSPGGGGPGGWAADGAAAAPTPRLPWRLHVLLWALMGLRHWHPGLMSAAARAATAAAGTGAPHELGMIAAATARLGHRDEAMMACIADRFAAQAPDIGARPLIVLAGACAYADCYHAPFFEAAAGRLRALAALPPAERAAQEAALRRPPHHSCYTDSQSWDSDWALFVGEGPGSKEWPAGGDEERRARLAGAGGGSTSTDPLAAPPYLFHLLRVDAWLRSRGHPTLLPPELLPDALAAWRASDSIVSFTETEAFALLRAAGCHVVSPFVPPGLPLCADAAVLSLGPRGEAAVAQAAAEAGLPWDPSCLVPRGSSGGGGAQRAAGHEILGPSDVLVVLEVDGPSHFARNAPRHQLGGTLWRDRLLAASGYRPASIVVSEWGKAGQQSAAAGLSGGPSDWGSPQLQLMARVIARALAGDG